MADLEILSVDQVDDHPSNPRVAIRDDVVEGIASNLNGEWPKKHALHVRPIGDRYQLLSGHHRKQAAIRAGIDKVWCWVEDMDDEAAFMELVTSNNQGELDPLEIGIHAFQAVPAGKRGRGNKGDGAAAYAKAVGKAKSTISELRSAGEVALNCSVDRTFLVGKAQHLAAIHKLPKECWEMACGCLANMSVAEVKEKVAESLDFEVPAMPDYFPMPITRAHVFAGFLNQAKANRLVALRKSVLESLTYEDLRRKWLDFLNESGEGWNIQHCQQVRIELETQQWERDNKETETEEVSVLLADPPWRYDFSETDSRQIENQYPTADAEEIATHLDLPWAPKLAEDCVLFMWATAPKLREAFTVIDGWGFEYKTHAVWDKEKIGMGYWFRGQHELLLVATRGSKSPPDQDVRFPSVFRAARDSKHSKKPACVYEAIETMFPDDVKFEMYQREERSGWFGGGNESP